MKLKAPLVPLLLILFGCLNALQAQEYFVSPEELDFNTVPAGLPASGAIFFSWYDGGDATVSATSNNPVFVVDSPAQVVNYYDSGVFSILFSPPAPGSYNGIITLTINYGTSSQTTRQVPVRGDAVAPFTVAPRSLSFGKLFVGGTATKELGVDFYQFNSELVIGKHSASSLIATAQSSNPEAVEVSPETFNAEFGTTVPLTVTFHPENAGPVRETITIAYGNWTEQVTVEGEGAVFTLSEPRVQLGGALIGCSTSKPFTIETGSTYDFEITPTRAELPFTATPAKFTAGAATPVTVVFTPVVQGQVQGVFRITARYSGRTVQQQDVPFIGVGVTAIASPAAIEFGSVQVGTDSASKSANVTTDPATQFTGVYTSSSSNPAFRVASISPSGQVSVVFAPRSEGPESGVITVQVASASDAECTSPVEIAVSGVGAATQLSVTPGTIDFGSLTIGQVSPSREIVISNQSAVEYAGSVAIENAAFEIVGSSALTVPAAGTARLAVRFRPAEAAVQTGSAAISLQGTPEGAQQPVTVSRRITLRGEGTAPVLSYRSVRGGTPSGLTPGGAVSFTPTLIGASDSVDFEVQNVGANPVEVTEITVAGGPFTATLPSLPVVIPPGGSLSFPLKFEPAELKSFSGTLQVGGATFNLSGKSILSGGEITGIGETLPLNQQPTIGVKLSSNAPQDLTGTLALTYTPQGDLPADPSAQFQTGGTTVDFTVPSGSDTAVFPNGETSVGFQTGTVAATFAFTATVMNGEADVTPTPAPARSAAVAGGAPVISRVLVESVTATGFTVVVVGYTPNREITQATFNLTGRNGVQVQPSTVTPSGIADVFRAWFASEASREFGSMFTLAVPFTISGESNAIASISATVSNSVGASTAASANLP